MVEFRNLKRRQLDPQPAAFGKPQAGSSENPESSGRIHHPLLLYQSRNRVERASDLVRGTGAERHGPGRGVPNYSELEPDRGVVAVQPAGIEVFSLIRNFPSP